MEEVLRQMLLIFGGLAIAGIFVHGMWTIRKKPKSEDSQNYEPKEWSYDDDEESNEPRFIEADFKVDENDPLLRLDDDEITDLEPGQYDELGLGEVRVISTNKQDDEAEPEAAGTTADDAESTTLGEMASTSSKPETQTEPEPKIYASVVTQPKPEFEAEQKQALKSKSAASSVGLDDIPEPPSFLLKKEQEESAHAAKTQAESTKNDAVRDQVKSKEVQDKPDVPPAEKFSLAEQARNLVKRKKAETTPRKRKEPKVREDQMRIDFDEPAEKEAKDNPVNSDTAAKELPQQEVLVLNVKAPDDKPIQGAALLPMLLTLGFKFGDQDIFHRHVNSNGKGPVLFSLANMFKPGNFNIDDLENFTTQGVSLFMILPIEGDPHQVFNMMHNAARKISDEFDGQVLDGRRSALNKQNLQQYVEKIREFERMRRIAR